MLKKRLAICVATFIGYVFIISSPVAAFELGRRYLDYGNGMINLDNITYITPQVDYIVTVPQDDPNEYIKQFGNRNMSKGAISDILTWFEPNNLKALDYYFIQIEGYIKFDDFTLTMVEKQHYLKIPSNRQDMERVRTAKGENFTKFRRKLRITQFGEFGPDVDPFDVNPTGNDPYSRFIRSSSQIGPEQFKKIKKGIEHMASSYRKIFDNE